MKIFSLLALLLSSLSQISAQQVYAIVTVAATNPTDNNARFVIQLDPNNAPRSVAQLKLLAEPGTDYYRNRGFATLSNNPSGFYQPSTESGIISNGASDAYTISINGNTNGVSDVPSGSIATVFRSGSSDPVATLLLIGNSWIHQKGPFDTYDFSVSYNSSIFRYILNVATDVPYLNPTNGSLSTQPFYDNNGAVSVVGGDYPYLTMGERSSGVDTSPGWLLQNEVINPNANTIDSNAVFGNHFANAFGNVTTDQTYAVAFANDGLTRLNTASSKLWVTGQDGNPNFEGRQTYIGTVVFGNYQNNTVFPNTSISGSRALVSDILRGSRSATLQSIRFETIGTPYLAIDGAPTIPLASLSSTSEPSLDFSAPTDPRFFTGSSPGQLRLVDSSTDLLSWARLGQSNFPSGALAEGGLSIDSSPARQFFRVNPFIVTYPSWPSQSFTPYNQEMLFLGRAFESSNRPRSLNLFLLDLNSSDEPGILQANGGDLNGTHILTDIEYTITSPFQGELSMESSTLPDTLKLRLYFDAHKPEELNANGVLDRFHRIIPSSSNPLAEEKGEFGLWQIQ